ncbi:hypothetical protein INR49_001647 [Caranx melampygus]|nr:hypothetical protein INR49_001647 [Caranx melampygus]
MDHKSCRESHYQMLRVGPREGLMRVQEDEVKRRTKQKVVTDFATLSKGSSGGAKPRTALRQVLFSQGVSDKNPATETMSKMQRHQQEALWEFVHTELTYINKLIIIKDVTAKQLFSNLPSILTAHQLFWQEVIFPMLQEVRRTGKPFDPMKLEAGCLQFHERFLSYHNYCWEEEDNLEFTRWQMENNPHFVTFVQWVETHPQCERMRLGDMQAKPHQRITKYPLLLKAVLKTTQDPHVQNILRGMLSSVNSFLESINDYLRVMDERLALSISAQRVEGYEVEGINEEIDKHVREICRFDLTCPIREVGCDVVRKLLLEENLKIRDRKDSKVGELQSAMNVYIFAASTSERCSTWVSNIHQAKRSVESWAVSNNSDSDYSLNLKKNSLPCSQSSDSHRVLKLGSLKPNQERHPNGQNSPLAGLLERAKERVKDRDGIKRGRDVKVANLWSRHLSPSPTFSTTPSPLPSDGDKDTDWEEEVKLMRHRAPTVSKGWKEQLVDGDENDNDSSYFTEGVNVDWPGWCFDDDEVMNRLYPENEGLLESINRSLALSDVSEMSEDGECSQPFAFYLCMASVLALILKLNLCQSDSPIPAAIRGCVFTLVL